MNGQTSNGEMRFSAAAGLVRIRLAGDRVQLFGEIGRAANVVSGIAGGSGVEAAFTSSSEIR